MIKWTRHASYRTYDRRCHPAIAQANLMRLLPRILKDVKKMGSAFDRVTIRSYPYHSYFVVDISDPETKWVLTYGNVNAFLPRKGDLVFTHRPNNELISAIWGNKQEHSWGFIN